MVRRICRLGLPILGLLFFLGCSDVGTQQTGSLEPLDYPRLELGSRTSSRIDVDRVVRTLGLDAVQRRSTD